MKARRASRCACHGDVPTRGGQAVPRLPWPRSRRRGFGPTTREASRRRPRYPGPRAGARRYTMSPMAARAHDQPSRAAHRSGSRRHRADGAARSHLRDAQAPGARPAAMLAVGPHRREGAVRGDEASRATPLREALNRLALEGLVSITPYRGLRGHAADPGRLPRALRGAAHPRGRSRRRCRPSARPRATSRSSSRSRQLRYRREDRRTYETIPAGQQRLPPGAGPVHEQPPPRGDGDVGARPAPAPAVSSALASAWTASIRRPNTFTWWMPSAAANPVRPARSSSSTSPARRSASARRSEPPATDSPSASGGTVLRRLGRDSC